jgi:hypothetical protein
MNPVSTAVTLDRGRFGISLPAILGLCAYYVVLSHPIKILHDPDTYLHIAVGRWILAHHQVPHHGIFSLTMPNAPWVAHEWLGEVILASLFDHFGWISLLTVTGLVFAAATAMLFRVLLRHLAPAHALLAGVLACTLAIPHLLARPHVLTLPILVLWVAELVRARSEDRPPPLQLAGAMVLWVNIHGGYMFGLVLAALLAGEAVLTATDWRGRMAAARGWGLFCGAALTAALITPFGIEGLLLPLRLTRMSFALSVLEEWRSPNFQVFQPLEVWIIFVLFGALALGWKLPVTRVGIVLLLVHMALEHARHGELVGFVAPLLLAPALARQLDRRVEGGLSLRADRFMAELAKPASAGGQVLVGLALATLTALPLRANVAQHLDAIAPRAALGVVKAHDVTGPVLNAYGFGDYLIFSGIEPFIDGRAELYGDAFISRYANALLGVSDQLPVLLNEYGITWTLLDPDTPSARLLDYLPGWRRLYADEVAVVHVHEGGATH